MKDARMSTHFTDNDLSILELNVENKPFDFGHIRSRKKQKQIIGFRKSLLLSLRKIKDLIEAYKCYYSLLITLKVAKQLKVLFQEIFGGSFYPKVVEVGGHYYSFPYTHAWGTTQYKRDLRTHFYKSKAHSKEKARLLVVLLSITNQCPLRCEHCFEWDNLNKADKLSLADIERCVQKIQSLGAVSIHLSGGEPMLRMKDMLPLIKKYSKTTAFWVLSSGLLISSETAKKMKTNGVSIVSLSLDHYEARLHDRFRRKDYTFKQVMKAAKNCIQNDLVCMLSLCISKENVNESFLMRYMNLAKDMGVAFVQILEPRSIGHYKGKKVEIGDKEITLLEEFYLKMNFHRKFQKYPIIVYHGYQNRRVGCFSSGKYSLYIDSNGDILTRPFCRHNEGNILKDDLGEIADRMSKQGCGLF